MVDNTDATNEQAKVENEARIMCYISKEMVPLSETVEVDYGGGKSFRVKPKYIKYETQHSTED